MASSGRSREWFLLAGLGFVAWAAVQPISAAEAPAPIVIGSRLELFVDTFLIDTMKNTRLELHHPECSQVVFTFDRPWEGPQSGYVTILKDGDEYRMYYRGGGDLTREYTCLALSRDGIRWVRPSLGLFEHEGSKNNNIIWTGAKKAYCESHNFSPFIDRNPACKPSERYKAVAVTRIYPKPDVRKNVLIGFVSPDGIHWKKVQHDVLG